MKVLLVRNSEQPHMLSGKIKVAKNELQAIKESGFECNFHVVYNNEVRSTYPLKFLGAEINVFWPNSSFN